ncbi:DUF5602 domain-containing protein [Aldersonia kunmingensis]|uniref:DUF5602 domain-containing protein n=1 Tax=Aldersonia kunmingensis TaxID=408066 RepID=UPI000832AE14|nr:DUF5602 domain-containing protein [Aldersonia kunmingensis]
MRSPTSRRTAGLVLAAAAALTLPLACSSDDNNEPETYFGPSADLGDGTVKAFTIVDADGNATDVGVRMSADALNGLTTEVITDPLSPPPGVMHMVDFPDQASETVFDHVMVDWNAQGHEPPGVFDKPHFDIHFYLTDMASLTEINPANPEFAAQAANLPAPQYVAQDYVPVPNGVVPAMGAHYVDSTEPIVPGQPYDFTEVLLTGAWNGENTFIEPMITRDYLLTKPTVNEQIKQPESYQKSGLYPQTYYINFDEETQEYVIGLGGLTAQTAS